MSSALSDPWKHRSVGLTCETCMWFVKKESTSRGANTGAGKTVFDQPEPGIGRCRRHSPTLDGYPAVFITDWCGDHKFDENKL